MAVGLWTVWLGHDANRTKSCYHFTFYSQSKLFQILNLIYGRGIGKYECLIGAGIRTGE